MKTLTTARFTLPALLLGLAALALPSLAAPKKYAPAPVVRMVTTKGVILIKLFPKAAPLSVANFEKLVNKGFYSGLKFHRIADLEGPEGSGMGHIIQGGDPQGNGQGGPGYTFKGEFPNNGVKNPLKHVAGAVAMARSGTATSGFDTEGSQFYICTSPAPHLDGGYAVFGMVIKGLDVAKQLVVGDKMTKVTMVK